MSKRPNKYVVVVGKAQELLKFLDACRDRPVFHRLNYMLIHLNLPEPTTYLRYFTSDLPNSHFFILSYSFYSLSHYSTDFKYSLY